MIAATATLSASLFTHAPVWDIMPPKLRPMRQFAAEEIMLDDGEREGQRLNPDFQRWPGLILDMFDEAELREYWLTGPRQTGKTLLIMVAMLYHLFERRENVIALAPTEVLAKGWWKDKILPLIELSRYSKYLPKTGPGSKRGQVESMRFGNGATLRFFTAGKLKASTFTARVIFVTEASKMEPADGSDNESNAIAAIKKCSASFSNPILYSDCITTTKEGIVNVTVDELGTASRIMLPCVHCNCYQYPERDRFTGWEEAPDEITAGEGAAYHCVACGIAWTEEDRRAGVDRSVIVHGGQEVNASGEVLGTRRRTNILGLRWNALCSALRQTQILGEDEWKSKQSGKQSDEADLCMYDWAIGYTPDATDLTDISAESIAGRVTVTPKGQLPDDTQSAMLTIDVGGHVKGCHWTLGAFHGKRVGHIADYGNFKPAANTEDAITAAILEFWESMASQGWEWKGGFRIPDLIFIDSGWKPEAIYAACDRIGAAIAKPIKGYSLYSESGRSTYSHKQRGKGVPKSGDQWHESRMKTGRHLVHIDGDYYKRRAQECFTIAAGEAGSMTLFNAPAGFHMRGPEGRGIGFAGHLVAEREMVISEPGKGDIRKWQRMHNANDFLDCVGYMLAGADYLGCTLLSSAPMQKAKGKSLSQRRREHREKRGRR